MALPTGKRIGSYEILGPLGSGGMGEVYRARDSKLERDVAIKVLPDALAGDQERLARFEREAKVLAALSHPNIATIYGREDRAIVMELVEGPTLADRLKSGPLPREETIRICQQIVVALEAAHEKGIVHRDLKPANIKAPVDAPIKVLDFGLATAVQGDTRETVDLSASPTLSMAATSAGIILGTAAYMSPEQAAGKPMDKRSDIWSFGVVLWEMLTGGQLFPGGETVSHALADVLRAPIDFEKIPAGPLRELLQRCLDRDVKTRLRDIGEARIMLSRMGSELDVAEQPTRQTRSWIPWTVAGFAVFAALAALAWTWSRPGPGVAPITRFTIPPPDGTSLTAFRNAAPTLAVSPNGRYVAFIADEPGRERTIWVRALDSLFAQRLDRTQGATYPFWSPDSQHIAYFLENKLMRIPVGGGAPVTICAVNDGEGGTWFQTEGQDGVIVFAPGQNGPLHRVPAQGGVSTPITKLGEGETGHAFPQFLPDGKRFLYYARGKNLGIYVQSLDSQERTFIVKTSYRAVFSPPGFLLYLRDSTLLAHRWNLETLHLEGEPVAIAADVRAGAGTRNAFSVSSNGVLAYRSGGSDNLQVNAYTRDGKPDGTVLEPGGIGAIALSPDGKFLIVARGTSEDRDLWLKDLSSGVFSRLTSSPGVESSVVWSPDSRRVAYVVNAADNISLFETAVGSGVHEPISGNANFLEDWVENGKYLLARRNREVFLLPVEKNGEPQKSNAASAAESSKPLFNEPYSTDLFKVSPDGKWVAYTSLESGRSQIMVADFPSFMRRRQISVAGGAQPLWRSDNRELFFLSADRKVMAVELKSDGTLETGPLRMLFQSNATASAQIYSYAATPDGKRFLMREAVVSSNGGIEHLHVMTNWLSFVNGAPRP